MLNRSMQRRILEIMKGSYPFGCYPFEEIEGPEAERIANMAYLEEHGLCDAGILYSIGNAVGFKEAKITARGLDFLEDDGGLSAILGTVVVKLHGDTVRDLLAAKIEESDLALEEKSQIKEHLKALPATVLQAATLDLLRMGLERLPDAIPMIQRLCGLG